MRRVLFARAAESIAIPEDFWRLRRDIARHAEIVRLGETTANHDGEPAKTRFAWQDLTADLVIVCVTNGKPDEAASPDDDLPRLARDERASIPHTIQVVTARGAGVQEDDLPDDLRGYRGFNLSSRDGYDAMLCRAVHGEIGPLTTIKRNIFEHANAISKVIAGVTAVVVGNLERTQDFLIGAFGGWAIYVHYFMAAVVLLLILSGALALLVPLLEPLLAKWRPAAVGPNQKRWRLTALVVVAAAIAGLIASSLPVRPSVPAIVDKHEKAWSQRLAQMQMEDGGFREHHDSRRTQAWLTGQVLRAQLRSNPAAMTAEDYQRAEQFLRRTQIVDVQTTRIGFDELQRTVQLLSGSSLDPKQLPQKLPSIAAEYDTIAVLARRAELPRSVVTALDTNSRRLFTSGTSDKGWGYFAQFDWDVTEIAAWVALSLTDYSRSSFQAVPQMAAAHARTAELLRTISTILQRRQLPDGGFSAIVDTSEPTFARTYSTIMAVWALSDMSDPSLKLFSPQEQADIDSSVRAAVKWLGQKAQSGGWQASPTSPTREAPFLGLAAQTLCVLDQVRVPIDSTSSNAFALVRAQILGSERTWISRDVTRNDRIHDSDRYLFPTTYVTEGSTFLWYPWTLAYMRVVATDPRREHANEALEARDLYEKLLARVGEFDRYVDSEYNYVAAEALIGLHWPTHYPLTVSP